MNEDRARQRLGRGLASLIGTGSGLPSRPVPGFPDAPAAPAVPSDRRVKLDELSRNPKNPRRNFNEENLAELTASIRVHGVVQPILVRPKPGKDDGFEIVAGERRWRAAKAAGLADVPVVIREISDRESIEIAIIENVQRSDLDAIEEALGYQMLIDEHDYTQADLAEVLGKSRSHVANTLRLLKLPADVQDLVSRGILSPGHARTAVSAADPSAFARRLVEGGLSVRQAEDLARGPQTEEPRKARPRRGAAPAQAGSQKDADTAALERLLSTTLGMNVEIRLNGDGGDIRIDYGNLEQLDEICRLLQARHRGSDEASGPRVRTL